MSKETNTPDMSLQAVERLTKDRADWLLDAIACATQDRRFLRGDPAYDEVVGEVILLNAEKAIRVALEATPSLHPQEEEGERDWRGAFYAESIAAVELKPGTQVVAIDSFMRAVARVEQFAGNAKITPSTVTEGTVPDDGVQVRGSDEVPTLEQALRWLKRFRQEDEVASTTPRKIAFELAGIYELLAASPKPTIVEASGMVERLREALDGLLHAYTDPAAGEVDRRLAIADARASLSASSPTLDEQGGVR